MSAPDNEPISRWLADFRSGQAPEAAAQLWTQYFPQLVGIAGKRYGNNGEADGEDIALSAFNTLCQGLADGKYRGVQDRDELWRLLMKITRFKLMRYIRRRDAAKRGGPDFRPESLDGDATIDPEPIPETSALITEEFQRLLDLLPDEKQRAIALLRMEGYSHEEISRRVGCAVRTVYHKLDFIRNAWREEMDK